MVINGDCPYFLLVPIVGDNSGIIESSDGTSFSSPYVAATITQLFTIRPGLTPVQAIEYVEATADDINDPRQGHGRVNVWKAFLSCANGHLSTQSQRLPSDSIPPALPHFSINTSDHQDTDWYGFEILTTQHGAKAWLYDSAAMSYSPLSDDGAIPIKTPLDADSAPPTFVPIQGLGPVYDTQSVVTRYAVKKTGSRIPYGEQILNTYGIDVYYLAYATIHTSQMTSLGLGNWKRLRIFPESVIAPPIDGSGALIDIELNPNIMRQANPDSNVVRYDDYVFTIEELPFISFNAGVSSYNENEISIIVQVNLNRKSTETITADIVYSGSAAINSDYIAPPTISFPPGLTTHNISLTIINDDIIEPNESIILYLDNIEHAKMSGSSEHTITIIDND